jgi:hypothetical protein
MKLEFISTFTNKFRNYFNACPCVLYFYGILCLIDILKFTLKCDIRPTLVDTHLVGTIFKTKNYSVYEKFLWKARGHHSCEMSKLWNIGGKKPLSQK